jgi:NitT/TauT family transport system substrate-binding protein
MSLSASRIEASPSCGRARLALVPELKDRTIGLHFDDPELRQFAEAVLVEAGLNPAQDVRLEPLLGGPLDATRMAGAVQERLIDAVWQLDIFTGMMEAEGLLLRHLPAAIDQLSPSSTLIAMASTLQQRSAVFGALGRAVAKATLFAMSDPEEAIRLVWREFPNARPQSGNEQQAWRQEVAALKVRLNGQRIDDQPVRKWGAITEAEIKGWLAFLRKARAISGPLAAPNCFHDELVLAFNRSFPERQRATCTRTVTGVAWAARSRSVRE